MPVVIANSRDPDQTWYSVASDLGLHCLSVSHLGDARHKWVKVIDRVMDELSNASVTVSSLLTINKHLKCFFLIFHRK